MRRQNVRNRQDRYQSVLDRFISEGNVSFGGSNGCADQLTNWDGTQKLGLGAPPKRSHKVYPDNDNERRFVALVTANRLKL